MIYNIFYIFILFLMYSFIGYVVEIVSILINTKKLTFERGFLIGPYLPIFGSGAFVMLYALSKYKEDLFALFIASFVLCGVLEYFTSFIMEKIYGFRWWDYSRKNII